MIKQTTKLHVSLRCVLRGRSVHAPDAVLNETPCNVYNVDNPQGKEEDGCEFVHIIRRNVTICRLLSQYFSESR